MPFQSKVHPSARRKMSMMKKKHRNEVEREKEEAKRRCSSSGAEMVVVRLHTFLKLYGGERCPRLETYEILKQRGQLMKRSHVPPDSTVIYVSHQWVGNDHPDPRGNQVYHLLLLLERLRRGDISRTDMDPMHVHAFKHNYTTTADEWKIMLKDTFLWYVPLVRREISRSRLLSPKHSQVRRPLCTTKYE